MGGISLEAFNGYQNKIKENIERGITNLKQEIIDLIDSKTQNIYKENEELTNKIREKFKVKGHTPHPKRPKLPKNMTTGDITQFALDLLEYVEQKYQYTILAFAALENIGNATQQQVNETLPDLKNNVNESDYKFIEAFIRKHFVPEMRKFEEDNPLLTGQQKGPKFSKIIPGN